MLNFRNFLQHILQNFILFFPFSESIRKNLTKFHQHWASHLCTLLDLKWRKLFWKWFSWKTTFWNSKQVGRIFAEILSGAEVCRSCRSRQELSNEVLHAKIGFDTAENEPLKVWRWFISFFNSLDCDCSVELSGMSTEVVGIRSEVMHQLTGGNYLLDFLFWTWQERAAHTGVLERVPSRLEESRHHSEGE